MSIFQANITVNLRPSVLDPAGEASKEAALRLGIQGVNKIRIGKSILVEIEATNKEEAIQNIEMLSDRLLSNPVIENWTFDLNNIDPQQGD